MSTIPTLSTFTRRRPQNVVAGQPRYANTDEFTEYYRSSPVAETSLPIPLGVAVAFTGDASPSGLREIQAVNTPAYTFVAADFAGFTVAVHEDSLDRLGIPKLSSDPTVYSNEFVHQPKSMVPRFTFKSIWVKTNLTVAPTYGEAVDVLAATGFVSNTGGVTLTGVVFTGELVTGWDGLQYACVNIVTPLAA